MPDDGLETLVAGIRCREVLGDLSAFLDGELPAERVAALQAHLAGCDRCSRFGGSVAHLLADLRAGLHTPAALPAEFASRLHQRLAEVVRP
ncbi:MAG: zf-HC2 domain-containing protein [Gemmatimonadaceae bacterium]|nr:zf-HC2 domain-containing protein [Gemmatimonadaceae bacterium]